MWQNVTWSCTLQRASPASDVLKPALRLAVTFAACFCYFAEAAPAVGI